MFHSRFFLASGLVAAASLLSAVAFAQVSPKHKRPQVQQPQVCTAAAVGLKGRGADLQVEVEKSDCTRETTGLEKSEVDAVLKDKGGPR